MTGDAGDGVGRADAVALGLAVRLAGGVAAEAGVRLGTGLDVGTVDGTNDTDGAGLAAWAPGVGTASGRIELPIAIAAISEGNSATATKTIDRD